MKKVLFLTYGIVTYAIFFATFCYAIGFVSSIWVPKHIDSVPQSPLGYAMMVNAALLALFAVQHSVMARPAFKTWWTKIIPEPIERCTYVLLASLCLIILFEFWEPMGGVVWRVESESVQIFLKAMCLFGFAIVLISTFLINHFDLFGLRQVWFSFKGKKYEPLPFRTPFFYNYVRHPLYLGFMVAFWSTPMMTVAHLLFAVMTTAYMLIAIQFEESDLIRQFGVRYTDYKNNAPMIIPFVNFSKRTNLGESSVVDPRRNAVSNDK